MAANSQKAIDYAHSHSTEFLSDLKDFLYIPSISTDPEHQNDMLRAAEWLKHQLAGLGFENKQIFPTPRHPVVYADFLKAVIRHGSSRLAPLAIIEARAKSVPSFAEKILRKLKLPFKYFKSFQVLISQIAFF